MSKGEETWGDWGILRGIRKIRSRNGMGSGNRLSTRLGNLCPIGYFRRGIDSGELVWYNVLRERWTTNQ